MKDRHANRRKQQQAAQVIQLKKNPQDVPLYSTFIPFEMLTPNQEKAKQLFFDNEIGVLVLLGSAGAGKTALAHNFGLELLSRKTDECQKVYYLKNQVALRDPGALPGGEREKFNPFTRCGISLIEKMFSDPKAAEKLAESHRYYADCINFYQGITLENCVVIVDEAQNFTWEELFMIYTRQGENCRMIICCDFYQDIVTGVKKQQSGLDAFLDIIEQLEEDAGVIDFTWRDCVRSERVKRFLRIIEETPLQ